MSDPKPRIETTGVTTVVMHRGCDTVQVIETDFAADPVEPTQDRVRRALSAEHARRLDGAYTRVAQLAVDLANFVEQSVDARTWGGPTIPPQNPITEQRAYLDACALSLVLADKKAV